MSFVTDLHPTLDPFEQFKAWFDEAVKTEEIKEANAMCLATSDIKTGRPSARQEVVQGTVRLLTETFISEWCFSRSLAKSPASCFTLTGTAERDRS